MNKDELFNLLSSHEWREVEFKEARSNVPGSSYETVSAFAYVCRKREVTLSELKAVTNLGGPEVRKIADRLCVQVLLKPINEGENYSIADHLRDRFLPKEDSIAAQQEGTEAPDLLREQVGEKQVDLCREQVGARPANLYTEQVGGRAADLFTEQVDAGQADLLREQVDERQVDLCREQVGESAADLFTEQVDEKKVDLFTEQVDAGQADLFTEQVGKKTMDLFTEQVEPLKSLSEIQWRIVALCEVPRALAEMMTEIGVGSRRYFKAHHLDPLIKCNVIRMTNPGNPRAANQKYVLTETGIQLKINKSRGKT